MKVMIAGGGTGGHVFPGIAVAEELRRRHAETEVVFVGSRRGLEAQAVPAAGEREARVSGVDGLGDRAAVADRHPHPGRVAGSHHQ